MRGDSSRSAVSKRAVRLQVRLWDVSAGEQVARLTGHTDYVRAAAASPSSSDSWATGVPIMFRAVQSTHEVHFMVLWATGMEFAEFDKMCSLNNCENPLLRRWPTPA